VIQFKKLFSRVPSMKAEEAREFIATHQEGFEKEHLKVLGELRGRKT